MKLFALGVDLDDLRHYRAIHGLAPETEPARVVFEAAVPRALDFAARVGAPVSFFCVARDLECVEALAAMRDALARGHAVESHSATHPYGVVRLDGEALDREVAGSFDAIERAVGARPAGFRAPGYAMSDGLLDAVERAGAAYDSSILPSPPYQAAKLAVMGALFATGRRSASSVTDPRAAVAPREPYRPGRPFYRRGDRALLELPIQVTRFARIPVIGTTLGLAGDRGARSLVRACGPTPLLNLELHAIDFLDRTELPPDMQNLPEVRVPLEQRLRSFHAAIEEALRSPRRAVTLREAAALLAERH